ncbi:hypothetical protein EC988_009238 [Linderina pennispora]|nr:hypothetical protein EC988_009238 [Linderina pennispora]
MFVLPETHRRMVSMKHRIQQTNIPKPFNIRDNNPLVDLALIRYPPVYISLYFFAMVFGTYVVNLVGLALAFEDVYGLSQGASGLCYFPVGAGAITGSLSSGRITDLMLRRYQRRRDVEGGQGGKVPPETRIRLTWISGTMFLVSIALSGWIINRHWSLSALLVVQFFTGLGMAFSFHSLASYLIDVFPLKSARITGVQNFYRGMWGAVVVQLFPTMLDSIDWGWTYMILVFIAVPGLAGIQFLVSSGEKLRHRFGPH